MLKKVVTNNAIGGLLKKDCKYVSKHYQFIFYSLNAWYNNLLVLFLRSKFYP